MKQLLYGMDVDQMRQAGGWAQDDALPTICGIAFMDPLFAGVLVDFHADEQGLDACTYYGVDSGAAAINFAFWLDLVQVHAAHTLQPHTLPAIRTHHRCHHP